RARQAAENRSVRTCGAPKDQLVAAPAGRASGIEQRKAAHAQIRFENLQGGKFVGEASYPVDIVVTGTHSTPTSTVAPVRERARGLQLEGALERGENSNPGHDRPRECGSDAGRQAVVEALDEPPGVGFPPLVVVDGNAQHAIRIADAR